MNPSNHNALHQWRISADTGGTFTDCQAIDPQGRTHRAKVLSIGALRATILESLAPHSFMLNTAWNTARDLLTGGRLVRTSDQQELGTIRSFHPDERRLELDGAPRHPIEAGLAVDIRPQQPEPAPILAARLVTETPFTLPLPPTSFRLATTRGTNALLERKVAPTFLCVTRGFEDLLRIRDQRRPELFALDVRKPTPLTDHVRGINERIAADGSIIRPLDEDQLRTSAQQAWDDGLRVAAVCFMNAWRNHEHERRAAEILEDIGFQLIRRSHDVVPLIKYLSRLETTLIDAALTPIVGSYLDDVAAACTTGSLQVMTSAGGLVNASAYQACDSLLSGPAGGVQGARRIGLQENLSRVIAFDMGGTSTDVSRIDGDGEVVFRHAVGDATVARMACAIHTVAAGGGSICSTRDGRLRVGPESAGADPGPACYGAGGPVTVTDLNLLAGRVDADEFSIPVNASAARHAFQALHDQHCAALSELGTPGDRLPDQDAVLDALLDLANQHMAAGIEQISIARGIDPADHALIAFGGAGGQHACAIAERLGMTTIILPRDASILSAVGLLHAATERIAERQVLAPLIECAKRIPDLLTELADEALAALTADESHDPDTPVTVHRRIISLRLLGQDATVDVELDDDTDDPLPRFFDQYRRLYGHPPPDRTIEIESMRVTVRQEREVSNETGADSDSPAHEGAESISMRTGHEWVDAPVIPQSAVPVDQSMHGPLLVRGLDSAFVIERGWNVRRTDRGNCIAERIAAASTPELITGAAAAELFAQRLAAIADDMGALLKRTSLSTNVKEREDYSCGVLDERGRLVVNAPHIPVHLGAMGACVRSVMQQCTLERGDMIITNHPAHGGSHLPDITIIAPVFDREDTLRAFVANRAHHAEIGGSRPGSMPPDATTLTEEGVVIRPMHIVRAGEPQFAPIHALLTKGPWPSRAPEENMMDLRAQIAANQGGVRALESVIDTLGAASFAQHINEISDHARHVTAAILTPLVGREWSASDTLDDGTPIAMRWHCIEDPERGPRMHVDFTGTGAQHPGNLNATPAIINAVILYVLRLMRGDRLPLNEAVLDAVDLELPRGTIVNPDFSQPDEQCPAVVGGNVEISQRLVNCAIRALNLAAESQGTMNNVLFGNDRFGYYETVCGGTGAGHDFDGCDAVQSHMTNTLMTDPEICEHRYPVRIEEFSIRRNSGGRGRRKGGCGVRRIINFLDDVQLSVLTQRRAAGPRGLDGGGTGDSGRQWIEHADGRVTTLGAVDGCEVQSGDRFILETPGGGGCGIGD